MQARLFWALLTVLIALSIYLIDASLQLMVCVLFIYILIAFILERSYWGILYLNVLINIAFLALANWFTDGKISFLEDETFIPYYKQALLLEIMFWVSFTVLSGFKKNLGQPPDMLDRQSKHFPPFLLLVAAVVLFSLELGLNSGKYFIPYTEESNTGTVGYELGCVLLALGVIMRGSRSPSVVKFMIEMLGVGLSFFIMVGSGKRLPFSYIILAYSILGLNNYGKARTTIVYVFIAIAGWAYGIFRDSFTLSDLNSIVFAKAFESTNQGAVLHASGVYLRVIDEGLITWLDSAISFFGNFIGSLIIPISLLPEQVQVNIFAMNYYPIQGNGGFIGAYSFFFLRWMGPILISWIFVCLCSGRSYWMKLVGFIILLTSTRWTLYNIGPIGRLISMTVIVFMIIELGYKLLLSRPRKVSSVDPNLL